MLYAFATHYAYTRDGKWLERIAPRWFEPVNGSFLSGKPLKTRQEGTRKVLHFGLLPIGRAYDTAEEAIRQLANDGELPGGQMDDRHAPLDTYYPCFTDSYSSLGLEHDRRRAGRNRASGRRSPGQGSQGLSRRYSRGDAANANPEPDLPPYPERLHRPPAWAGICDWRVGICGYGILGTVGLPHFRSSKPT